ncbi:MAG: protein-export chaperone SecB [Abyssibacter sp.]|uniref:protein-export chaperone SecB n=1 Tax=Abyssibacter sp. TaxID=2320200 RepID=UPI002EAB736E|nr:protein-export chaperone SecB [Pseudomonadota bacterium]
MAEEQAGGKQVVMQKVFIHDASLEVPKAPQIFTRKWEPKVDLSINTAVQRVEGETYQVTLTVTLTTTVGEEAEVAYICEIQQAGIFVLQGITDDAERRAVLGAYCPNVLFPFAREAVNDFVQRGGFPQMLLQPVNFDAVYQQHLAQKAEGDGDGTRH